MNSRLPQLFRIATYIGLGVVLLFWLAVGARILLVQGNHIGLNLAPAIYLFIAVSIVAIVYFIVSRRAIAIATVCIALAGMYGLSFIDKNNLLVKYEVWIKRGMPAAWGTSTTK